MDIMRAVLCVVLPPLAVIDKGVGPVIVVTFLTVCGWVPGIIGAICLSQAKP